MECARREMQSERVLPIKGMFQSLFLWNVLVEGAVGNGQVPAVVFQSLFLWNVLVETDSTGRNPVARLFQSLFLWNVLVEQ